MAKIKSLRVKRGQFKSQLKRFSNFLEDDKDDPHEIRERLNKIIEVWDKFQNLQYAIIETRKKAVLDDEEEQQLEQIEMEENEQETEFENTYFRLMAIAKRKLAQFEAVNNVATVAQEEAVPVIKSNVKLPTITLPTFNGQYSQWLQFKDAFISLIDKNTTLMDIQKLQYLRGSLKGEAIEFLEGLETTTENYKTAWELLTNHYENQRLIINTHLKELFETAAITKCNRTSIRQFVNHIRMHVKALAMLKLPVEQWDAILIYLAVNKLDYNTRKDWETHISTRGMNELPKMNELLEFLTGRYHMLEMVEKEKSAFDSHKQDKKQGKAVALTTTASNECEYCKGAHRIFNCEKLIKLPIASRTTEIRKLKLCINCLQKGHWSKECRSQDCKICKGKHNSLLHIADSAKEQQEKTSQDVSNNIVSTHCAKSSHQVLLSTAKVYAVD